MLKTRVIPCLQLIDSSLVKTVKFKDPAYIGDPVNTVRIFNELEVDELCFLDIRASVEKRMPNYEILKQIADECFMPLSYGGGITDFESARKIFASGFEKIVLNTSAYKTPHLITKLSEHFGAQAIIGSVDFRKNLWGKSSIYINDGTENTSNDVVGWATKLEEYGVGEILLTSMDRDGSWAGYDVEVLKKVNNAVSVPVIANGGAGEIKHLTQAVKEAGVSAVALGSMVVYQKKGMGVLVNFPDRNKLTAALS